MPSNKAKIKRAAKRAGPSGSSSQDGDLYLNNIDDVEDWKVLIDRICAFLKLPDLTTRSGIKKVHADFNKIYAQMEGLFDKSEGNIKIQGAIVGIFAKLSADALLRNKLFEKGALDKILPLIHFDEMRHLSLRALSTFTHHGGRDIRFEIAKSANVFTKLIRDFPDDEIVANLSIGTITHSVMAVVEGEGSPGNPQILKAIDMVDILKTFLEVVKRPYKEPLSVIEHTVELLSVSTMHSSAAFKAYPSAINFLAAGVRSRDWTNRCICLRGLDNLFYLEAEQDRIQPDPYRFSLALNSRMPDHLSRLMMKKNATMNYKRDGDLYALGLKQAALIQQTEFAISDGIGFALEPHTNASQSIPPSGRWSDSLPLCAKAIREKGKPEEADLADILDIKYCLGRWRHGEAVEIAKTGLERNPEQAYFHYAQSMSGNPVHGLRAAKKGLKCKTTTNFLKYQLMQRAAEYSALLGIQMFQNMPQPGDRDWEEGITLLTSAFEDAKEFLESAPPDNRYRKNVGYWYIILKILLNPDISPNLEELKEPLKDLAIAFEFGEFMGLTPAKTNLRLTQEALVKHYPPGVKEFEHVFENLDKIKEAPMSYALDSKRARDDLSVWLEDIRLEDGTMEQHLQCGSAAVVMERPPLKNVNEEVLTSMYRCSWCRNPSAALRKCSQCSKTRYCDSACQKAHWRLHKKDCKTSA